MPVTSSVTTVVLARKWLAQKLIALAELQLVLRPLCDEVKLDLGMGTTANFAKVARADLPPSPLTEGVDPVESTFPAITNVPITVVQWGAFFTITDVAELTTSHPILQIATERLADVAARLIDTEIGKVMLAGTNVRIANAEASRAQLLTTDTMTETELHKMRTTMANAGAPPRTGSLYDLVIAPQVAADLMRATANYATWAGSVARDNPTAFESASLGSVLGFNVIQSNYLPFFSLLGQATQATPTANASTVSNAFGITGLSLVGSAGGNFTAAAYPIKITSRDAQTGYESLVTIGSISAQAAHTVTFAAGFTSLQLTFPSTVAGQTTPTFNVYIGSAGGSTSNDAILFQAVSNAAAGSTALITTVPTSGANPPASPPSAGTKVYIGFVVARSALNLVTLQNLQATLTPRDESESNPLALRRKVGFKFMMKAGRRDETRLLRWEGASNY